MKNMVKIEDIGVLATLVSIQGNMYELELCGERFLMPQELCRIEREETE